MKISRHFLYSIGFFGLLYLAIMLNTFPFSSIAAWRDKQEIGNDKKVQLNTFQTYDLAGNGGELELSFHIIAGEHFWYPQMAVWLEDHEGTYLETLMVTNGTAKGVFYGGRTKENFKDQDLFSKTLSDTTVRVDALPYWSHKRNVRYPDGYYSPAPSAPLPDAISGATPSGNFILNLRSKNHADTFRVLFEVNVAFDDNEFYSEYDYPEDEVYHSGTGQLGQPSLIYTCTINRENQGEYYMLKPIGHGHHSAKTGNLYPDLSKLTTALEIIEYMVVRVN